MSLLLVPLSPRRGLIYGLLGLAETAWLSAVTFGIALQRTPLTTWFLTLFMLVALAILLGWLTDVYGIPFQFTRIVGLGLALFGILSLTHMTLYPDLPFLGLGWFAQFLRSLIVAPNPVVNNRFIVILLAIGYIWWRGLALGYTPPELPVSSMTLQLGFLGLMMALLLGAFGVMVLPSMGLIFLFATTSLLALSLSYTETIVQHHGEGVTGGLKIRLANGGLILVAVIGMAFLLATIFSFSTIETIFALIFTLLDWLLRPVIALLIWVFTLIGPLFDAFAAWLQSLVVEPEVATPTPGPMQPLEPLEPVLTDTEPVWWSQYLLWGWRAFLIFAVIWLLYRLMGRFIVRRQPAGQASQTHERAEPEGTGLGDLWNAGKNKIADLTRLIRQFGLGQDLRAAVAIRRIYAALLVLAGQRGLERVPSQTPSEFLAPLSATWPHLSEQFTTITNAYIYVHYGQLPEGEAGLDVVQQAWQAVYESINRIDQDTAPLENSS